MKLTPAERAEWREHFRRMNLADKIDYIFTYFKIPLFLGLAALLTLGEVSHRMLTRKDPILYLGFINVAVGEELEQTLNTDFVAAIGQNPRKAEIVFYPGMYLSDDASVENHEYAYASRLKLLASVDAQRLDVVLMNRDGYDILSAKGYLLPLTEYDDLPARVENEVVLEDNTIDYQLREADELRIVTEPVCNGTSVGDSPLLAQAGFSGEVYAGILANSPRVEDAVRYLHYLAGDSAAR